jgi:hypothetical protein
MCAALPQPTESLSTTRFAGLSVTGFFALVRDEVTPVLRAGRQRGHGGSEPAPPGTTQNVHHPAESATATDAFGTTA